MKKLYLLALGLCWCTFAYGQKVETSLIFNSGVSKFEGELAANTAYVTRVTGGPPTYYTNNPYGNRPTLTYGAGLQVQLVTPINFLLGTQAGFEQLRSNISIDQVYGHEISGSTTVQPAKGSSMMRVNFMNLQPYLGWRIASEKYDLDIAFGSDIGFIQKIAENGEVTTEDGTKLKASREYTKIKSDIRPRIGLSGFRGPYGASVSYAHGVKNYEAERAASNAEVYMRVFRICLLYRL